MKRLFGRKMIISFILPMLIISVIFFSLNLVPFGSRNLLISDMGTQYLPFFAYLRESFLTHSFHPYSFVNGMGGSVLGLYGYYLLSPLNVIFLLFPVEQITTAVMYLILLKIGLIGLSSYLYFHFSFKRDDWSMVVISTVFSLSGYVSLYFTNIMWLDALIFFPMVMLGIQLLFNKKKIALYLFSLCLTIITNYYLGYMTCLFSVLYFVYLFIAEKRTETLKTALRQKLKQIKLFIFSSLCAGGLSGVVLVPSLLDMLRTNKSEMDLENFSLLPNFSWDMTRQIFPFSVDFENRLKHLPTIFIGVLLVFSIRYFFSRSFSKKMKWLNFTFLFLLFLSFWLPLFNTVWHMMQKPAGFPYRNAYMFSFVLLILAYESYIAGKEESKHEFVRSFLIASICYVGFFLVSILSAHFQKELAVGWLGYSKESYVFIAVVFLLFVAGVGLSEMTKSQLLKIVCSIVLCAVLFVEMGVNFRMVIMEAPFGYQQAFVESTTVVDDLVKKVKKEDPSFYRISNEITLQDAAYSTPFNHYNDSFLFNFYGIPLYSSTLDEENRQFLKGLGLYSKNERRISYAGETKVTNLLLDVKYCLMNQGDFVQVRENPEAIGIGFGVDSEVLGATPRQKQPLLLQDKLLQQMTGSKENYFSSLVFKGQTSQAPDQVRMDFSVQNTGQLYIDLTKQPVDHVQIFLNGRKINLSDNEKSTIHDLGKVLTGDQIQLILSGKKTLRRFQLSHLQVLDEQRFEGAVQKFRGRPFELTEWDDGYVDGKIDFPKDQVLLLSIPYHENWRAELDGQKVKTHQVMNGLMAIEVPAGKHRVTLTYPENSLWVGLVISFISGVMTVILFWWNGKKRVKVNGYD